MNAKNLIVVVGLGFSGFAAHAFPIAAPGTEGISVIVNSVSDVIATYEGNSASYSNDLYLERDPAGNPGMDGNTANDLFIFNNHGNNVGDTAQPWRVRSGH